VRKALADEHGQNIMALARDLAGASGMLSGSGPVPGTPDAGGWPDGMWSYGFLFAPALHQSMKHAAGPRKEIGIRTVFNLLGPLTNPAGAASQLVGVFDGDYCEKLAWVLGQLGSRRALVVAGLDGLDEVSLCDETRVAELNGGKVRSYSIAPEDFNLHRCTLDELKGGDAAANAAIIREILEGQKGPKRDIVLLNAGAALMAAGVWFWVPEHGGKPLDVIAV